VRLLRDECARKCDSGFPTMSHLKRTYLVARSGKPRAVIRMQGSLSKRFSSQSLWKMASCEREQDRMLLILYPVSEKICAALPQVRKVRVVHTKRRERRNPPSQQPVCKLHC